MDFWTGLLVGIAIGCIIGALHTGRARRYWQWRLGRKLQLLALRNEMKHQQRKPTKPAAPEISQRWKTFLSNHLGSMASMDFKVTFDWRGKLLYILNCGCLYPRIVRTVFGAIFRCGRGAV